MTKEVGISVSSLATLSVWECEQCLRQWSDTSRHGCPYCRTGRGEEYRWDDVNDSEKTR